MNGRRQRANEFALNAEARYKTAVEPRDTYMQRYENQIRMALGVAPDATVEDILNMIRDEGWTPSLISSEIDEPGP